MRAKRFFLDVAGGFDRAVVGGWRFLVRWWSSPWVYATMVAVILGLTAYGLEHPAAGFGLGCGWLFIGFRRAINGPSFVLLRRGDPSSRGLFRTHLLVIFLFVALLAIHDYDAPVRAAYLITIGCMLLAVDKDVEA